MASPRSTAVRRPAAAEPLLADLPAHHAGWLDDLPPCPAEAEVTVARSRGAMAHAPSDALRALGYVPVGTLPRETAVVQLSIPREVLAAHPTWWTAVLATAVAVWDTALGPVALARAGDLCVHRDRVSD